MKRLLCAVAAVMCAIQAWAVPTDYLVLRWSVADGLVADYHQIVDLPPRPYDASAGLRPAHAQLLDAQGQVVGQIPLTQAMLTRAEFHGHDHIDGQTLVNDEFAFVVRAAQGSVDRLLLPAGLESAQHDYNFKQLVNSALSKGPQTFIESPRGGADNRVNLLFMGDGYTSAQENTFHNHVSAAILHMLSFVPYQNYANFISFDRLFTASSQSGADKPAACFNPPVAVNTAFDATFCTSNIQRLLTINNAKVLAAAAASPDWDLITVVVNDPVYGGAGGFISTFSTNSLSDDIFIHEYGHSFTQLADEYDTPFPGYPACSDLSGNSPCEANVTDVTTRQAIKWNHLIDGATPVPTPTNGSFDTVVGLFEGARYLASDMYRPKNFCNMRNLGIGFCEVCQEAYVKRLYAVPYASGGLLSLIEPDSAVPANPNPSGNVSVPMNFAVDTLQPNHDLEITWRVGGVSQGSNNSSATNQSFQFTPMSVGQVEVKVEVKDNSAVVDPSQHGSLPTFEQVWQVDVQPFVDLIFADDFE